MMSTGFPRVDAATPLHYPRRRCLDADAVASAVDGPDLGSVSRLLGPATLMGDHDALVRLGPVALSHPGVPQAASIKHERLIAAVAGSFAGTPPTNVRGLGCFAHTIADNVAIVRMSLDLGATHRIPELAKSFENAELAARSFSAAADAVASSGSGPVSKLARWLGWFGRLDVADSFCRASLALDQPWPAVTLAASYRHLHRAPAKNIELNSAVLALNPTFTPALNSICAAHVDLLDAATGVEFLLRSLALNPDHYAGNTGRRAFRAIGRSEQSARCSAIAHARLTGQVPPGRWSTVDTYCAAMARAVLLNEGRDELAQAPLSMLTSAAIAGAVPVAAVLGLTELTAGVEAR